MKKLRKDASTEEISKYLKEAMKDAEFRKDLSRFIEITTGRKSK